MTAIHVPGYDIWVDPDEITKIEIFRAGKSRARIEIFLEGERKPRSFKFPDMNTGIRFYDTIWRLRRSDEDQKDEAGYRRAMRSKKGKA